MPLGEAEARCKDGKADVIYTTYGETTLDVAQITAGDVEAVYIPSEESNVYRSTPISDPDPVVVATYGCKNETASNYDPANTYTYHKDSLCQYPVPPIDPIICTDVSALNYGQEGACTYPPEGSEPDPVICTDETALNYNQEGACTYPPPEGSDGSDGSGSGSGSTETCGYYYLGNYMGGTRGCDEYGNWSCDDYETCVDHTVYGCTNPSANNYNSSATSDDGSCIIYGCTDSSAINYNPSATTDDGSCESASGSGSGSDDGSGSGSGSDDGSGSGSGSGSDEGSGSGS